MTSEGTHQVAAFRVSLSQEGEPPILSEKLTAPAPARQRLKILVVEDNRDAADTLRMLLDLLGHEVRVAYTGTEGLQMAVEWAPTVVLSDIGLPGMDGFGLARALRRNPPTADVKLIAITGYGSEQDRKIARESGFDHLLTKPADPGVLLQLLAETV